MEAEQKIKTLEILINHHYRLFSDRVSYIWKINFFLWAGLAAIISALLKMGKFPPPWLLICIAIVLFLIYFFIWVPGSQRACAINKKFYNQYADALARLINDNSSILQLPQIGAIEENITCSCFGIKFLKFKIWFDWAALFQIVTTILLIVTSTWLLWEESFICNFISC